MIKAWTAGLVRQRGNSIVAASLGVALAVCLLAVLGLFVTQSSGSMTARALTNVSPYWQVQLVGTADPANALAAIAAVTDHPKTEQVNFADVSGFSSNSGGTVQSTGVGKVVGVSPSYFRTFANQGRLLAGSWDGPLLIQQTAANLHASPGDKITISRLGQPQTEVTISGVIEMPSADQFFQVVNGTAQASRNAPPDNVLLLPASQWETLFQQQLETMPQTAQRQIHLSFNAQNLPPDPVAAYVGATGQSNNLLAKLAGEGVVTNNLAARLDGVRQDSLFAKVLFLFLGIPGALVALFLTVVLLQAGAERRRLEIGLLQLRGFSNGKILNFSSIEGIMIGILGAVIGLAMAQVISKFWLAVPQSSAGLSWFLLAGAAGLIASVFVASIPALLVTRRGVSENLAPAGLTQNADPAWKRLWLDVVFLLIATLILWQSSTTGYRVVTAPEGVATATVDYKAYLAPGLMWIGSALLLMRLAGFYLRHGQSSLTTLLRPVAKRFSGLVAASMVHERGRIVKGIVLVALAMSFATSTAIFNSTYQQQALVDATLTNGADVAIVGTIDQPASQVLTKVQARSGVAAIQPMQHRLAYVGTDLQDLYGIDSAHIGEATPMSDAYFQNGSAAKTLAQLQSVPDGILVSDETVTDFQLKPGDKLNLRLRNSSDGTYHVVPFTFVGVVREFPTAPTDSFLVANFGYVAQQTGIASAETLLIKASGNPHDLTQDIGKVLPPESPLKVSDVSEAAHRIGSSLTAVDLHGLTALELAFAVPLVAGALGLVFALGLSERRRSFAVLLALGAKGKQLGSFLWSEALVVFSLGMTSGLAIGWVLAWVLVKLMTHVFDPPPDALAVPWAYLVILAIAGFGAMCGAVLLQLRKPSQPLSFAMRRV
ncbi:MAG: FtsX-like permease family protein [Alphaproteobacteria bacterium]|nr:FtsX-like permease family protein [Alphaproteobacteria bacterium]